MCNTKCEDKHLSTKDSRTGNSTPKLTILNRIRKNNLPGIALRNLILASGFYVNGN